MAGPQQQMFFYNVFVLVTGLAIAKYLVQYPESFKIGSVVNIHICETISPRQTWVTGPDFLA